MSNQEAIKIFKVAEGIQEQIPHLIDAYRLAIEALEKQIPKRPIKERGIGMTRYKCICGEELCVMWESGFVSDPQNEYCHKCGQAIDWSDDEEVTEPTKPISKMTQEERERFFRGE